MSEKRKKTGAGRRWVLEHSRGHLGKMILLSLLCMASSVLGIGLALGLKQVVDYAVEDARNGFYAASMAVFVILLTQIIIGYAIRYLDERSRAELENTIKSYVWFKIMERDYGSLEHYHTGELMNRLSNDVKVVSDNMITLVPSILSVFTRLICAMAVLFFLDWRFAAIFATAGCIVLGISVLFRRKMKALHKGMQEAEGRVRSFQQEMLESILVIRSFGAEHKVGHIGEGFMQEHKEMRLKKNLFSNFTQTGFSILMNAGYLFGIVWCGLGILAGTLSYGTLLAVQQLIGQIQQPIASIAGFVPRYYAMIASAERLIELEELPEDGAAGKIEETGQLPADFQTIMLDGVTAGYGREGESVLENAAFEVRKGDMVAVTGESGVGKSTLLKLLLCLYPLETGMLCLTDAGGNTSALTKKHRKIFAYVPQGNFLMSGSIREIVSVYGMKGCMSVEEACEAACAGEYIKNLPEQYETRLGERGAGLSEGQMQRLAIARALYIGAPVLLLDEATSALDEGTELQVLKNIREMHGKTVIIVTHRPAALDFCNRRVEIIEKKIIERQEKG